MYSLHYTYMKVSINGGSPARIIQAMDDQTIALNQAFFVTWGCRHFSKSPDDPHGPTNIAAMEWSEFITEWR